MSDDLGDATTSTTTSRQDVAFTPEALEALRQDLAYIAQLLAGDAGIGAQTLDVLSDATPLAQSLYAQPTLQAAGAARQAVGTAGAQRGLSPHSLARVDAALGAQQPALLSPLAGVARETAGNINSRIDPRLAPALRPNTVGSSSSSPSPLETATTILGAAGSVAAAGA